MKISIASPAYNEEKIIQKNVLTWINFLSGHPTIKNWEIVICNDGSTDKTQDILEQVKSQYPDHVIIINLRNNQGAAAALTRAINATNGDSVLLLDSDGQFPIENLDLFLNDPSFAQESGYKGARSSKKDSPFMRLGSFLSGKILNFSYEKSYKDFNSAFMLINSHLLRGLNLEAKGLNYSTDITSKLAEKNIFLKEVSIEQVERKESISTKKAVKCAVDRLLFVLYLIFRKFLLNKGIIEAKD